MEREHPYPYDPRPLYDDTTDICAWALLFFRVSNSLTFFIDIEGGGGETTAKKRHDTRFVEKKERIVAAGLYKVGTDNGSPGGVGC